MVSYETERLLVDLFATVAIDERQVEIARRSLNENVRFEPYHVFKELDRLGIGSLTSADLREFMNRNRIYASESEIYSILKQYDSNSDGRLTLTDFQAFTLPATSLVLREATLARRVPAIMSSDVEFQLALLFEKEVLLHRNLEASRQRLNLRYDFNLVDAYRAIDIDHKGFVDPIQLSNFIRRHHLSIFQDDIDALLRRFDNDGDGRLSYTEFVDAVMTVGSYPRKPAYRPNLRPTSPNSSSPLRRSLSPTARFNTSYHDSPSNRLYSYRYGIPRRSPDLMRSYTSFRASSPLRPTSPRRIGESYSYERARNSPLRQTSPPAFNQSASFRSSSPLRHSPRATATSTGFYKTNNSFRASSPLRSSPRASATQSGFYRPNSPLRASSPTRRSTSPYRSSSPLRSQYPRYNSPQRSQYIKTDSDYNTPQKSFNQSTRITESSPRRSFNNLSEYDERELVSTFQDQIRLDRELENAKVDLSLRADFNLEDAFRIFDYNNKGYLTASDFEGGLTQLGLRSIRDEAYLVVRHFSSGNDARVTYGDFSTMLAPNTLQYSQLLESRMAYPRPLENRLDAFSYETVNKFRQFLKLLLDSEAMAEGLRQKLERRPKFNMYEAFLAVDQDRNGFITQDEFDSILKSHGIYATQKDVLGLMDRYDKNKDGRVSYSEFVQEISPKSPRKYQIQVQFDLMDYISKNMFKRKNKSKKKVKLELQQWYDSIIDYLPMNIDELDSRFQQVIGEAAEFHRLIMTKENLALFEQLIKDKLNKANRKKITEKLHQTALQLIIIAELTVNQHISSELNEFLQIIEQMRQQGYCQLQDIANQYTNGAENELEKVNFQQEWNYYENELLKIVERQNHQIYQQLLQVINYYTNTTYDQINQQLNSRILSTTAEDCLLVSQALYQYQQTIREHLIQNFGVFPESLVDIQFKNLSNQVIESLQMSLQNKIQTMVAFLKDNVHDYVNKYQREYIKLFDKKILGSNVRNWLADVIFFTMPEKLQQDEFIITNVQYQLRRPFQQKTDITESIQQ